MSDVKQCDGPGCDALTGHYGEGSGWVEVELHHDEVNTIAMVRVAVGIDTTLHFHDWGCHVAWATVQRDLRKVRSDDA